MAGLGMRTAWDRDARAWTGAHTSVTYPRISSSSSTISNNWKMRVCEGDEQAFAKLGDAFQRRHDSGGRVRLASSRLRMLSSLSSFALVLRF